MTTVHSLFTSYSIVANSGRVCAWISGIPVIAVGFKGAKPLESPPQADGGFPQKYLTGEGGKESEPYRKLLRGSPTTSEPWVYLKNVVNA